MAVKQEWNIRRVLIVLTRWWWWPTLTVSLSIMAAWLYLRYTAAIYRSEATFQLNTASKSLTGLSSSSSDQGVFPIDALAENYIELFTDFEVLKETIQSGDFNTEIYSIGKFGRYLIFPNPIKIHFSDSEVDKSSILYYADIHVNDEFTFTIKLSDTLSRTVKWGEWFEWHQGSQKVKLELLRAIPPGDYLIKCYPVEKSAYEWQSRIRVLPKRGFTIFSTMLIDISAPRSHAFLTNLLKTVKNHEEEIQKDYYHKTISYIDTLTSFLSKDINKDQDTIQKYEISKELPLLEARRQYLIEKYSLNENDQVDTKIKDLDKLRTTLDLMGKSIMKNPDSLAPIVITANSYLPNQLHSYLDALNQYIKRYNLYSQSYQKDSPVLNVTLMNIRRQIEYILSYIEIEKYSLLSQKSLISNEIKNRSNRLYSDIEHERQFSLLMFNWDIKKEVYRMLLEKRLQLKIEQAGITSLIRITQPPILPASPLSPNPFQVYAILLLAGIILGVGGILLREVLTQQVSYRVDIDNLSPVPVIGELPASRKSETGHRLGNFYLSDLQVEVLRSLRNSIDFLWEHGKPRVIIVTSTVSREGKSFVSAALAYIHALTGRKTLLVDGDLRRGFLSRQHGLAQKAGLSNLLGPGLLAANGGSAEDVWAPFLIENLYFLPTGPQPPNVPELLASQKIKDLLISWSKIFDYIVIDTSPVGLVPDALSIFTQIPEAITLYVFRADYSRISFLNHLEDLIKFHHIKRTYLLFNGTRLHKPLYGYGYGYGYYGESYGAKRYYRSSLPETWQDRVRKWLPF